MEREGRYTDPRTRVAHKQVVAALLGRVLGAGLARDPVAERALLAPELARRVAGLDPVGDLGRGGLVEGGKGQYGAGPGKDGTNALSLSPARLPCLGLGLGHTMVARCLCPEGPEVRMAGPGCGVSNDEKGLVTGSEVFRDWQAPGTRFSEGVQIRGARLERSGQARLLKLMRGCLRLGMDCANCTESRASVL
jgi:hypothetical protein